jgi:hypothetical protein
MAEARGEDKAAVGAAAGQGPVMPLGLVSLILRRQFRKLVAALLSYA